LSSVVIITLYCGSNSLPEGFQTHIARLEPEH